MARYYKCKFLTVPSLPPIPRQDWKAMLKFLLQSGVPKSRISKHTGMSKELIYKLLDNQGTPFYPQAERLKQLVAYVNKVTPVQLEMEVEPCAQPSSTESNPQ